MTRSSQQQQRRRQRARVAAAVVVAEAQQIQHATIGNTSSNLSLHDDDMFNLVQSEPVPSDEELELMDTLQWFETQLIDPYLSDTERNHLLREHEECLNQLELLREQNEEWQIWRSQQEQLQEQQQLQQQQGHHVGESQDDEIDEYVEEYYNDQQFQEQIREIAAYEAQQEEDMFMSTVVPTRSSRIPQEMGFTTTTTTTTTTVVGPIASTNHRNNRSFRGYILNPNQDVIENDDDHNHSTPSSQLISPGSSSTTSIISADFGDDDVLPIEEKSCVICLLEYKHGDEVLRNATPTTTTTVVMTSTTCNHVFHTHCITSWIESSGKSDCPCCRCPFAL